MSTRTAGTFSSGDLGSYIRVANAEGVINKVTHYDDGKTVFVLSDVSKQVPGGALVQILSTPRDEGASQR